MQITLNKGYVTQVDVQDFEYLNQWKWLAEFDRWGKVYAIRQTTKGKKRMHRVILNAPDGMKVDHRDSDGLNNQRSNIRLATALENSRNARKRKDNTSGYSGVSRCGRKWIAHIKVMGKRTYLGRFHDLQEAAQVRREAELRIFGEFAPAR